MGKIDLKIDFNKYTVEQLKNLISEIENYMYDIDDGHIYICKFAQYGSNWSHTFTNLHIPEKYADDFNGDNGIMDVYLTNPNIKEVPFDMYGDFYYIESLDHYEKYIERQKELSYVNSLKRGWKKYNDWVEQHGDALRDIWHGGHRPPKPSITEEELSEIVSKYDSLPHIAEPKELCVILEDVEVETHSEEGDI